MCSLSNSSPRLAVAVQVPAGTAGDSCETRPVFRDLLQGGGLDVCGPDPGPWEAGRDPRTGRGGEDGLGLSFALVDDPGREAVVTCREVLVLCKSHVGDSPGQAAIAILVRVDGNEPEARDSYPDDSVKTVPLCLPPLQERINLSGHIPRGGAS